MRGRRARRENALQAKVVAEYNAHVDARTSNAQASADSLRSRLESMTYAQLRRWLWDNESDNDNADLCDALPIGYIHVGDYLAAAHGECVGHAVYFSVIAREPIAIPLYEDE